MESRRSLRVERIPTENKLNSNLIGSIKDLHEVMKIGLSLFLIYCFVISGDIMKKNNALFFSFLTNWDLIVWVNLKSW